MVNAYSWCTTHLAPRAKLTTQSMKNNNATYGRIFHSVFLDKVHNALIFRWFFSLLFRIYIITFSPSWGGEL